MRESLHAEWTKLRTLAVAAVLAGLAIQATIGLNRLPRNRDA